MKADCSKVGAKPTPGWAALVSDGDSRKPSKVWWAACVGANMYNEVLVKLLSILAID
jgi:hypothetical protein